MAGNGMNPLDASLQAACPCVMVPRHETLPPLEADGHRFLMGGQALFIEIRRPWVHVVHRIVDIPMPLPYGDPEEKLSLAISRPTLTAALSAFIERARQHFPLEHAAWWNFRSEDATLEYHEPEPLSRGAGHVQYLRPQASASSLPFLDCHSHGIFSAFFSDMDDQDDLVDDLKLAFVVGSLDLEAPSVVMRLVGLGVSLDLSAWTREILGL
jgi:PRTRC genetic system protein A